MTPRAELRTIIRRMAFAAVPHLPRELQIDYVARVVSREAELPASPGLVKNWWYALDDDERGVDSRHMDWARSRSRTMSANDNRIMAGGPRVGDCLPGSSEALIWAVAA